LFVYLRSCSTLNNYAYEENVFLCFDDALCVAFAYAEGTPASTKLPVEKISAKKFSEALKNEQNSISF
jgi:hypothetical protein